ncbi:MAG: DcaP family trimeric outer membrane transporter, partial [Sphingobium sp.]
ATTFKVGGFVKAVASATRYNGGDLATGSLNKEFYVPAQIPVGGAASSQDFMGNARQTRLFFDTSTPLAGKDLKTHIEFDFALATAPAGAQRATNPYTPTLRRAFINYGRWLFGQEWTTFQNPNLFPETTDFVGPLEGAIFVRQMMVQYRQPLGQGLDLYVAAENPQTETLTATNATLNDNDTDRIPDFVAKLAYKGGPAELHVAGIVRQLSIHANGIGDDRLGWGVSGGGKIVFGPNGRHDVRFNATYGSGLGRYLGLGYAPDAIYDSALLGNRLYAVDNFAGFASVRLGWTDTLRSTLTAGYQHAGYPGGILIPGLANRSAYAVAGNLFWSPVKALDLGIEYRHAQREVVNGLKGDMDRVEMAAKYTF